MTNLLIFGIGTTEIILIVLIIVLLFGATKIPALMRGIGQGVKSFRDGMEGKEDTTDKKESSKEDK
ncbi:MAG: twin-arginine translocase TatA/TatE family subunit [Alistipes sp.]|jgi:sec-independent protein translocase protein TatA|nr:twin-arginine translocase TatA/TatE family subunit [Alistipes sp.]